MFKSCDEFKSFISTRITDLREQKGISARDMSLSLGYGAGYINNIENKNNMPSMESLYFICEFFNVAPKDFFDDELQTSGLLLKLMAESKKLDRKSIEKLLEFIQTLK